MRKTSKVAVVLSETRAAASQLFLGLAALRHEELQSGMEETRFSDAKFAGGMLLSLAMAASAAAAFRVCLHLSLWLAIPIGLLVPWSVPLLAPAAQRLVLRRCKTPGWNRDRWLLYVFVFGPWLTLLFALLVGLSKLLA